MDTLYRYPHGDREWSPHRTVTMEELWDGSTFDYHPLVVATQTEYDYLKAMELMLGTELHELLLIPDFASPISMSVELRIPHLE